MDMESKGKWIDFKNMHGHFIELLIAQYNFRQIQNLTIKKLQMIKV